MARRVRGLRYAGWALLAVGHTAFAAAPEQIPPGRLTLADRYVATMSEAGYELRRSAAHDTGHSILEFTLPGKPQADGWDIAAYWAFDIRDEEEEAKVFHDDQVKTMRSKRPRPTQFALPGGVTVERTSWQLLGDAWAAGVSQAWFQVGAVVVHIDFYARRKVGGDAREEQARQGEEFILAWSAAEAARVWGKMDGDELHEAVMLVLRAIGKLPPLMASVPAGGVRFASDTGVRLVANDPFCAPWYAWPATADEALAPALRRIVEASTQQPERLAQELTAALNDPEVNKQVYFLVLAGEKGSAVIHSNLSARLPADAKLLRYIRGRQRLCRQQTEDEWRQVVADGQFCAGIFFATVDTLMSVTGVPAMQASGAVLSYAQIIAKMQEQDPKLRAEVPADMQKLIISGVIQAHPEWHWSVVAPLSFADVIVGRWKANWDVAPGPRLAEDISAELAAVPTEGAWIDLLDTKQVELARAYVFNQAVFDAFGKIFEANGWSHEDRLPLEPAGSNRLQHLEARRKVAERAEEARLQIPAVAYYAGRDADSARASAVAPTVGQ